MAVVNFSRKIFEREIGKLDEKTQTRISMFGTPVEAIDDKEIQIEIFPNRPDLLSYHGFKRAFLAFLGKKTGLREYKIKSPEKDYKVIIESSVKSVRPYTACTIVRGLRLDDEKIKEIIEIQEKIHATLGRKRKKVAIGIYPLDKIKLPITFKAIEPDKIKFIPLETEKEMSGLEILQRHPAGKEYAHLLSGKEKFPLFVDAANNILSMPPIINSELTGKITAETKDIFVECSGFDFEILKKSINILATMFSDMGGTIYQMEIYYGRKKEITPNLKTDEMKISAENTNKLLGLELKEKQIKYCLEKMGHAYSKGIVKIPSWRTDVLHEVDLIEDVAIAYGLENFVPEIPDISTIGGEDKKEIMKRKICEILSGLGMLEVSSYHLTNKIFQFKKMNMPEENFVELEESKTDYNILRKNLSHYLLKIFSENPDSEYPQKIFEIGKVFESNNEKINESEKLALAVSPGNFTDVKQILEYLAKVTEKEIKITESEESPNYFIHGRTGKIILNGKAIGFIGEIHPKILRNWKIKMPVSLFEIDLEEVLRD
ncbi:MAG: phenylalanine--tRNA ligase subunit beta [archaeon]